ncbi:hypothetical protein Tco_0508599 [Tanacetum coccineum]
MEDFIGGLPKSIEGNVTALKPQTLEEAINITQRTFNNNNYQNDRNNKNDNHNNDHQQQHNRRQETFRAYAATPTENHGYVGPYLLVRDALSITQDLVLSDVRLVTKWAIRPGTAETKDPRTTRLDSSYSFC